jgi:hypothetical protein
MTSADLDLEPFPRKTIPRFGPCFRPLPRRELNTSLLDTSEATKQKLLLFA